MPYVVHFIASYQSLIDAHFPNMETVAGSILYFDGTWTYTAVACSFTAFGGSYAPGAHGATNLIGVKLNLPKSQSSLLTMSPINCIWRKLVVLPMQHYSANLSLGMLNNQLLELQCRIIYSIAMLLDHDFLLQHNCEQSTWAPKQSVCDFSWTCHIVSSVVALIKYTRQIQIFMQKYAVFPNLVINVSICPPPSPSRSICRCPDWVTKIWEVQ